MGRFCPLKNSQHSADKTIFVLQEIWWQMNLQGWHLIISNPQTSSPKKSMIQTTGNCSFFRCHHNFKNSKTYGNLFSKKQSAQLPYNEASHHRVNISRLGNWVSSVFCHFNRRFLKSKSEAHESFMASKRFLSSSARSAVR